MFPLRDENPTELTPFVTAAFVIANVVVWLYFQGAGVSESVLAESICRAGMIPAEVTGRMGVYTGVDLGGGEVCSFGGFTWQAVLSSMFLHGSWLHLIGNMWFLWLFGNNVEDSMGHIRFVLFYLLVGVAAAIAHVYAGPESPIPTVGASGAVSGVMGAYLVLYPRVRIHTLFIFLVFIRIIPVSAWFILLYWFLIQVFSGAAMPTEGGGVAFWAHVGGFVAGVLLIKLFANAVLVRAKKAHMQLEARENDRRGLW